MNLPKLEHPTFTLILPSTQQKITYRPFLVREEKLLLIAQESGEDQATIVRAIKQVITNCIIEPIVVVDNFTTFDLEYFFIKLRAKSVNNIVSLTYRDNEDQQEYKFDIDLDKIEIVRDPKHTNIIPINKTMQLVLKYPQINIVDGVQEHKNDIEFSFDILKHCLDKLIVTTGQEEEIFLFSEHTQTEVQEFMMSLGVKAYKNIQVFFDTMPQLKHVMEYTNQKGKVQKIELRKLDDFFMLG